MIKARIRRIQREMANKRMMADIPKADVIITNPTHIACAIKYDPKTMAAPVLLAKGADAIAEKIKELAREHNIPVMENKPLARTVFQIDENRPSDSTRTLQGRRRSTLLRLQAQTKDTTVNGTGIPVSQTL